ncbi:MAG: hypothetical protein Q9214_002285 [Letrouitia sp. 1 TL-2023]
MRIPTLLSVLSLLIPLALTKQQKAPEPCTIFHPTTNAYYDLNAITVQPLKDHKKSWHAWGYDYGTNFSLNFCAPVIEPLESAVGIGKDLVKNISAFYKYKGETYSIGQVSTEPVFRGRKLSLNYTSGSPCDEPLTRERRKLKDDDDDDDKDDEEEDDDDRKSHKGKDKDKDRHKDDNVRRKSTLISFSCDQNLGTGKAHLSFIGASPDECAYFFEAKSVAACGGVVEAPSGLGAGGVFSVMFATPFPLFFIIFLVVYILGGVAYQRTVMHQRGWRQLPNYNVWASIANLLKDLIVILTSSCARVLPRRQGYSHLPPLGRGGRSSRADDENRLIDQLDEEWDD